MKKKIDNPTDFAIVFDCLLVILFSEDAAEIKAAKLLMKSVIGTASKTRASNRLNAY